MLEYKINQYIKLEAVNDTTEVFINDFWFATYDFSILNVNMTNLEDIDSIEKLSVLKLISAFEDLTFLGDPRAKTSFKSEIAEKFVRGSVPVMNFLFRWSYLECFTAEELINLYEGCKSFLKETRYIEVRINLANILYNYADYCVLNYPKKAADLFSISLQLFNIPDTWYQLGRVLLKLRCIDMAMMSFRHCIYNIYKDIIAKQKALEYLGQIYLKRNDLSEAKKVYLELCSNKYRRIVDPWYYLKVVYERLGDFKKAKKAYKEYKRVRRLEINRWGELKFSFKFKLRRFKTRPWKQLSICINNYYKITRRNMRPR